MFDLDQAVDEWCRSLVAEKRGAAESLDELKDHVYCIVECLQERGTGAQSAFEQAVARLGDRETLIREHAKNQSWKTTICQLLKQIEGIPDTESGEQRMKKHWIQANITNALAWAAMMIGAAIILQGTEQAEKVFFLLLSGWFISFVGLQHGQGASLSSAACEEWRWIRTKLLRLRSSQ